MRAWILGAAIIGGMVGSAAAQDAPPPGPPGEHGFKGPERGRLFISPMGEPFRGAPGGPPPQDQWFDGADTNHDGVLTVAEMTADGARFFAALDMRHGEIDPDDIERYESQLAPEIRVGGGGTGAGPPRGAGGPGRGGGRGRPPGGGGGMGGGRGGMDHGDAPAGIRSMAGKQGAGRFGYLDYPEPITVADRNFNRGVDPAEFAHAAGTRFAMLDANGDGRLEKGELPKPSQGPGGRGRPRDGRETMPPKP